MTAEIQAVRGGNRGEAGYNVGMNIDIHQHTRMGRIVFESKFDRDSPAPRELGITRDRPGYYPELVFCLNESEAAMMADILNSFVRQRKAER